MSESKEKKITCYSDGEGEFMAKSQAIRGRLLLPLLTLLQACNIRPGHLTFLSLLVGLAFCPVFLWSSKPAAMALLVLHVLLDGLDGPLARHIGRASDCGSFTDTMADQMVVTFSALTLIHVGMASLWAGGMYLFFYAVVVMFAMARNAMEIPYSWLVRPRFFVFLGIPVELYLWPGSLNVLLWIVSALLAWKVLTGFVKIRNRLK